MPKSWLAHELHGSPLPERLYLKPRDGSASKHNYSIHRDELPAILPFVPNPIIQEFVTGSEITCDCLFDFNGQIIHAVPRHRIRVMAGECVQGVTIPDEPFREWLLKVLKIISSLGGRGPMTVQLFLTDDGPVLSEINPRFGGGIPLTIYAGGDYPEWILQMVEGREVAPRIGEYRHPAYMTRTYTEIFTDAPLWL